MHNYPHIWKVGIGCVAFNEKNQLLVVKEKAGGINGIW